MRSYSRKKAPFKFLADKLKIIINNTGVGDRIHSNARQHDIRILT